MSNIQQFDYDVSGPVCHWVDLILCVLNYFNMFIYTFHQTVNLQSLLFQVFFLYFYYTLFLALQWHKCERFLYCTIQPWASFQFLLIFLSVSDWVISFYCLCSLIIFLHHSAKPHNTCLFQTLYIFILKFPFGYFLIVSLFLLRTSVFSFISRLFSFTSSWWWW